MSKQFLSSALILLIAFSIAIPISLRIIPTPKAHAQTFVGCIGALFGKTPTNTPPPTAATAVPVSDAAVTSLQATGNGINTGTQAVTTANCINAYVITPLIRIAIHIIIQKMTATIINWINGGNGNGQPSYVQNLQVHLQAVGTTQMLAFFSQFGTSSNSPFVAGITSALKADYLYHTTSAAYFQNNRDTLSITIGPANEAAFLGGAWSSGGTSAWLALTTQSQNNPYMVYQSSQRQLGSVINGAQSSRLNELSWANGFLSWCPGQSSTALGSKVALGDTCKNPDGTTAKSLTPGTIIAGYANQAVVQNGFQQLFNANDIDSAFNAIVQTLLNKVLNNGLFSASQNGTTDQLQNYGNNQPPPTQTPLGSTLVTQAIQAMQTRLTQYQTAWSVIRSSANYTSSALTSLANVCPTESGAAQTAITGIITPLLTKATAADATAAAAQAMYQQVQNELNSGDPNLTTDAQTLEGMPPTDFDVTSAQQATQATGGATANPAGSLTVSGGTTIDQLALLATDAASLKAACR